MDGHEDLTNRLHALGEQPVDSAVASQHLTAMAMATPGKSQWWARARVGAAFAAGLLLGGTSLAAAAPNVLPDPVQNAFSSVGGAAGLNIDKGTERSTEGCDGTYKNHGQYVAAQAHKLNGDDNQSLTPTVTGGGNSAAAHSNCGKPVKSLQGGTQGGATTQSDTNGCGKPSWAGKGHSVDKAAKAAAQAERRQRCGGDEGTETEKQEAPEGTTPTTSGKPAVTGQSEEDHGKPTTTGKPASPGKSADVHTDDETSSTTGRPAGAGQSGEHVPTTSTSTTSTTTAG